MPDRFQGDPRITIDGNGAEIDFIGGQPIMDQGLENQGVISLFTTPGWWGNVIEPDPDKKIGSNFEDVSKEPITRGMLQRSRKELIRSLQAPIFKNVDAFIDDLGHNKITIRAVMTPPSGKEQELLLTRNGQNWISQRDDPAHLK